MIVRDHGYLTIAEIDGDPRALDELHRRIAPVMDDVGRDHGLLVHVAARTPEGLVMVNLWPSSSGSEAAARDPRRGEQLMSSGLRPEDITRRHLEVARVAVFDAS